MRAKNETKLDVLQACDKHFFHIVIPVHLSPPTPAEWKRRDKVSKTISFRHMCTSHTLNNTVQHDLMTCYGGPTLTQIKPFTKFEYILFGEHRSKAMLYTVAQSVYALHTAQCV